MKKTENSNSSLSRRDLPKSTAAGLAFTDGIDSTPQAAAVAPTSDDPITKENAKSGTRDWMLAKTDITSNEPVELWRSSRIEGYCSETSVSAGAAQPPGDLDLSGNAPLHRGNRPGRGQRGDGRVCPCCL